MVERGDPAVFVPKALIRMRAGNFDRWNDDTWSVDSTSVGRARRRETTRRSDCRGPAGSGYGASHFRYFWGLRGHWVTATPVTTVPRRPNPRS